MPEITVSIRVKGLTCDGCSTSLARALQATRGVKAATVSLEHQQATVTYNPDEVDEERLRAVVHQVGFVPVAG